MHHDSEFGGDRGSRDVAGNAVGGHPDEGLYCTFDSFDESLAAKSRLQLPTANTARYRIEFETLPLKQNAYVPYGRLDNAEWFEPIARDFPELGNGGGSQFLIKDSEISIKRVFDLSTSPPTVIYTRP